MPIPLIAIPESQKGSFINRIALEALETATNQRIREINAEDKQKENDRDGNQNNR